MNFTRLTTIALLALTATVANAAVQRSTSEEAYSPLVVLSVAPPALTTAYAVEDTLTGNALPTQISHNGSYDAATGKIKWGPFLDAQSRTLSYRISGPAGVISLNGKASYDGSSEAFSTAALTLPDPNTTFYGYQYQNLSNRDFIQFPLDTSGDTDGDGISDFYRHAFASVASNLSLQVDPLSISPKTATFRAYVSSLAADTSYAVEASTNLSNWEPITNLLPSFTLTSRAPSVFPGTDELRFTAVPLDSNQRLFIRLQATWLAAPAD